MQKENAKAAILRKLYVMKKIGASHTPVVNIQKSFPKHLRGEVNKVIVPELIKDNLLLMRKHNYGFSVSLNPGKIGEIREILIKNFPNDF